MSATQWWQSDSLLKSDEWYGRPGGKEFGRQGALAPSFFSFITLAPPKKKKVQLRSTSIIDTRKGGGGGWTE